MNKKTNNKELLDDVLSEAAPTGFREGLLDTTLQHVRRRRRFRYARNTAGLFIIVILLAALVFPHPGKRPITVAPTKEKQVEQSYTVINTLPLSSGEVVRTHSLSAVQFISSRSTIEIVESTRGNYRLISDQELLALVAAHHAALVRTGPNTEKLIFANPADAKTFLAN